MLYETNHVLQKELEIRRVPRNLVKLAPRMFHGRFTDIELCAFSKFSESCQSGN